MSPGASMYGPASCTPSKSSVGVRSGEQRWDKDRRSGGRAYIPDFVPLPPRPVAPRHTKRARDAMQVPDLVRVPSMARKLLLRSA
jgi:hypothetical protein